MIWDLPTSLDVNGKAHDIRTDYRDIIRILIAFDDPNLSAQEKQFICLYILYVDMDEIPPEDYDAALNAAVEFIDNGATPDSKRHPRTMDWEQDATLLFPAVNKSAGFEVRSVDYLHWWTFLGYFYEIRDSTYSTILSIRGKKSRHKKLEKWEKEFWQNNRNACELKAKLTEEELAEKERLKAILG